jgi:hypothetical protein
MTSINRKKLTYPLLRQAWYWIKDGKFASLLNQAEGGGMTTGKAISLGAELARTTDIITAIDLICDALVDRLAKLMMVPVSDSKSYILIIYRSLS